MTASRRVVVTGLGQVSALGLDVPAFAEAVFAGRSGIARLAGFSAPGIDDPIAAAIPGFDPALCLSTRALPTAPRAAQYAVAAAMQAVASAGLGGAERERGCVFVGTGFGGIAEIEETYRACFAEAGLRPRPTAIPTAMANAAAGLLASELRFKGENLTFATACSSATHAIGHAFRRIRAGEVDVALAGGADAPLTPVVLAAWGSMRVLAPAGADPARACRPFDRTRQGIVVGEGAGFLVLEAADHVSARGGRALAEVAGYGANADAGHVTRPDVEGVKDCIRRALHDAGVAMDAVGYVNAHGTGTPANDATEARAIADVFADRAKDLPVSSTKAVHGHVMGAAGGLETIATVLALRDGRIPPTAHLEEVDPALPDLDYVAGAPRSARVECALKNSFAFGGNNAVLVLRQIR